MSFQTDLGKFVQKTGAQAEDLMQKVVVVSLQGIMSRTPVDTGRARANWNIQAGTPNLSTTDDTDEAGAMSRGQSEANAVSLKDRDVYITNNLPYAKRLEYGWSDQATHGMVRVTAAEVRALIQAGRLR
jgi:hypothetical protein